MQPPPPTFLADRLAYQVPGGVRSRGRMYFRNNAVSPTASGDRYVQAQVQGSRLYHVYVGLGAAPDELDASCSCPYFDDLFDICKHIWALILYADRHRLLAAARVAPELFLLPELSDGSGAVRRRDRAGRAEDRTPRPPPWRSVLAQVRRPGTPPRAETPLDPDAGRLLYLVDTLTYPRAVSVTITIRERRKDGRWGKPRPWRVNDDAPEGVPDPRDREILALLLGSDLSQHGLSGTYYSIHRNPLHSPRGESRFFLRPAVEATLLQRMCRTERCFLAPIDSKDPAPLKWDDGPAWEFRLGVDAGDAEDTFRIRGRLVRGDASVPMDDRRLRIGNAAVFLGNLAAKAVLPGEEWASLGAAPEPVAVPPADRDAFLEQLFTLPGAPALDLSPALGVQTVQPDPVPHLTLDEARNPSSSAPRFTARLQFRYDDRLVRYREPGARLYDPEAKQLLVRNLDQEIAAGHRLAELGFRVPKTAPDKDRPFTLSARNVAPAVRALVAEGWHVEARGKRYRGSGEFRLQVTSGIDWFDLDGSLEFGDARAALPELLRAAAAGEDYVRLDDGTLGLLPEDWLARYGFLKGLGTREGDRLRFTGAHVAVLDALLETLPEARYDDRFAAARRRLNESGTLRPVSPPSTFRGRLREYQKEGLGWMEFLREAGFGGCLADDMGLGKTVQVLALLDARRHSRPRGKPKLPSLAVVPRSVLWNWKDEAARFTPRLRVHVHAGPDRKPRFPKADLVLTTYGTLHRDIVHLKEIPFDYVVLDEAQAVKNPRTGRAKAVRLLQARHRLALSGTPIENHLGELWSLFEFLNPGMLGSVTAFQKLTGENGQSPASVDKLRHPAGVDGRRPPGGEDGLRSPAGGTELRRPDADDELRHPGGDGARLIARAVRPFVLRRTKSQVAPELPERTEQTIHCELKGKQLRRYRELREHYRASLMQKVEEVGLGRSKIHVLEALLRLRQAACHPALIDPAFSDEAGAKIDTLVPRLQEIVEEGNKALVFSQFTRFLALVREHLDREGIVYEYLDGRTRKREERVTRFQEDPDCPLFLISLKAGGLGLNLTAAGYVFLLDPWWNPAVEAQAIDRAHRIGQTRHVFAYRLIATDTVEERILELQDAKRDLAASIITEDRSLLQKLRPEDLEVLLS